MNTCMKLGLVIVSCDYDYVNQVMSAMLLKILKSRLIRHDVLSVASYPQTSFHVLVVVWLLKQFLPILLGYYQQSRSRQLVGLGLALLIILGLSPFFIWSFSNQPLNSFSWTITFFMACKTLQNSEWKTLNYTQYLYLLSC